MKRIIDILDFICLIFSLAALLRELGILKKSNDHVVFDCDYREVNYGC